MIVAINSHGKHDQSQIVSKSHGHNRHFLAMKRERPILILLAGCAIITGCACRLDVAGERWKSEQTPKEIIDFMDKRQQRLDALLPHSATNTPPAAQIRLYSNMPPVLLTNHMVCIDYVCSEFVEGGGMTDSLLAGCSPAGVRVDYWWTTTLPDFESETLERFDIPWSDLPTNLTFAAADDLMKDISVEPADKSAERPRDSSSTNNPTRDEIPAMLLGTAVPTAPGAAFEFISPISATVRSTNLVLLASFPSAAPDPSPGTECLFARVSGGNAEILRTVDATGTAIRAHSRIDVRKIPLSALPSKLDLPGRDYEIRRYFIY